MKAPLRVTDTRGGGLRHVPARERLLARVRQLPNGCWEWLGFTTPQGYGACGYRGKRNVMAHRAVFTELRGEIEDGLTLDHLCHTRDHACLGGATCPHRRCVNPDHMEPVTSAVNVGRGVFARKTHCPRGHPYAGNNLGYTSHGSRYCLTCARVRANEQTVRLRAERAADWKRKPRTRPTHCKHGHPFDEANTYVRPNGRRGCKTCLRIRSKRHQEQRRVGAGA